MIIAYLEGCQVVLPDNLDQSSFYVKKYSAVIAEYGDKLPVSLAKLSKETRRQSNIYFDSVMIPRLRKILLI
jgi:hypothetical protein